MNPEIDDPPMVLISHHQYYPPGGIIIDSQQQQHHQFVPQQGPTTLEGNKDPKPRRRQRNKKNNMMKGHDHQINNHVVASNKRKLSEEQVNMLEQSFGDEHKLESERKDRLAAELGLDPRQVAVWFQNRRARYKSKKLEEEYATLKAQHETTLVHKCRLHAELLKVKEQLDEAEKEIYRLSEISSSVDGFSSNSPSSTTFSMEAAANFLGPYEIINMNDNVFYEHGLEWDINLYNYM